MAEDFHVLKENKASRSGESLPWDDPQFIIGPGRWYYGMAFVELPPRAGTDWPFGGDITALAWRFESSPTDWVLTYRFRYSGGDGNPPFDGTDRKSWHAAQMQAADAGAMAIRAREAMAKIGRQLCGGAQPDWFLIEGDQQRYRELVALAPAPWMTAVSVMSGEGRN
jgi:hypothetical protein